MVEVYVLRNAIDIGRQGENLARNIIFDLADLINDYGNGTATLVCLRPSDKVPYVCETSQDGNTLTWTPTSTDTAYAGSGKCELRWVVGETLAKSIIYTTTIAPSITGAGEVPSPYKSWYDAIIAYIEANYAANGAPQEVREAIYTLLSKAAYTETGLADELAIVQAWTAETIFVTNNLTHVTNSNTATMAEQGGSYTGTLTADSGYTLGTVSVTMGGEDVTATVYSSGTITIPSVTGDIVITATAVAAVASLSAVYTQSGTVYDTDALDTLKADLVVTATYSDSSTAVIPSTDYTLSGTLGAGTTSTITVSYGGKTATFDVVVASAKYSYDITDFDVINGAIASDDIYDLGGYCNIHTNFATVRRTFMLPMGDVLFPVCNQATGKPVPVESQYSPYPIPIPSDAVKVTVSIEANTQYLNLSTWNLDAENHYKRDAAGAWQQGTAVATFTAGAYGYLTILAKKDNGGSSYTDATEPTGISVLFE